uniref:Proton-dependent oligopeptide transporter family n=1 Tax=Tanacetum cinerariifolium TaxID=118510 RepID=A0A699GM79_TANCI|nr:proton-dependent oligopeptide transporter family [Tanacetum cinerariifolium]
MKPHMLQASKHVKVEETSLCMVARSAITTEENLPSQIVLHEKPNSSNSIETLLSTRQALVLLALSTLLSFNCGSSVDLSSCSPQLQVILFFISLYLVAIAQGGHKPCVQAFGADQFDTNNPEERKAKSSFFNWWYFGLCSGSTVGIFTVSYIQDNLSWGLGFGIPSIIMGFALIIFLSGTMTYRIGEKSEERNAFVRIACVLIKSAKNRRTTTSALSAQQQACRTLAHQEFQQFRFLNKALVSPDGSDEDGAICSIDDVQETKAVLRLVPIWTSLLENGNWHRLLMVVAAIIETKRLKTAHEYGLVDDPSATIRMKVWWLLPQCLLAGAGDVFTIVGMQEFFYEEMPNDLKSIGLALYLSVLGIGSFLSSFLISIVEKMTSGNGQDGWISDNVNKGHIDYFYYLLAGISAGAFMIYIYVAKSYVYNRFEMLKITVSSKHRQIKLPSLHSWMPPPPPLPKFPLRRSTTSLTALLTTKTVLSSDQNPVNEGVEVAERFVYNGVSSNLIIYLVGRLGQSTTTAAENTNMWSGTALFLPILIPIYDIMLVPLLRAITNKPSGIAMLQRIGTGIVFSILLMLVVVIIKTKRLKTAYEYGLVDDPSATIPMKPTESFKGFFLSAIVTPSQSVVTLSPCNPDGVKALE